MNKKSMLKYIIFVIASVVLILIDQVTKYLSLKHLCNKKSVPIIDNVLELTYVENRGAAFGILQDKQTLFFVLTIVVLVFIIYSLINLKFDRYHIPYFIFLTLIFSGAMGNFIDRLRNKCVVDMIYFKPIDFPVFNFADICITCGCILLIYSLIFIYKD